MIAHAHGGANDYPDDNPDPELCVAIAEGLSYGVEKQCFDRVRHWLGVIRQDKTLDCFLTEQS